MTETEGPQDQTAAEREPARTGVDTENLRDYQRLRRSRTDRKIAGVAGGLGRHLNIDPTVLRVLFVVLVFFGGAGLLLYAVAWLIVPEEGSDKAVISSAPSTRNALLIVAAVVAALLVLGDAWGPVGGGFPWPLALIAIIVLVAVLATRDSSSGSPPDAPAGQPAGTPSGTSSAAAPTQPVPASSPTSPTSPTTFGYPPAGYPPTPYASPAPSAEPPPDRGPKLFGYTLALVAIALGALGLYESAGGAVADAAYAALALAVVGVMLVVGSVAGRPGGLILLGIVAAVALAVAATVEEYDMGRSGRIDLVPTSVADLDRSYSLFAGEIDLDLTQVSDPENYLGRTVSVTAEAGEIVVLVPPGVDVDVDARIDIGGEIDVNGVREEGRGPAVRTVIDGGLDVPVLNLDVDLSVGTITVTQIPEANAS